MPTVAAESAPTRSLTANSPARPPQIFSSPGKRTLVLSLALMLLTLAVYHRVDKNDFINFDDPQYLQNPHVAAGPTWETVKWAFTTSYAANWHPLTWLSHAIDSRLFGFNPAGHHGVNGVMHALNVLLLFVVLLRLTNSVWRSLIVAALFAVHPLNVESVAWAAERKTLLSMLFFLLALWVYALYVRRPSLTKYLGVASLFALGLMAKSQVITFPLVLLLLDYWPLRRTPLLTEASADDLSSSGPRSISWILLEKIPLLALSALSAVITIYAQHAGDAVRTSVECPLPLRIENAIISYFWYVRSSFVPWHLAPLYPYPPNLFQLWKVVLAAAFLISVSALAVVYRKKAPFFLVGWLWFLGTLVPMIGLVQVGVQARADRYMYIPEIGVFLACIWGITELLDRLQVPISWRASACVLILALFASATYRQIGRWRNSEILWKYTISVTSRNYKAEDILAQYLAAQGRTAEAITHFHNILGYYHWHALDLIALGMYEQRTGYAADALQRYQEALDRAVDDKTRAIALTNTGSAYLDLKDEERAQQNFNKALQYDPRNARAILGEGVIAHRDRNFDLAISRYKKAILIEPSDLLYLLLSRAYERNGSKAEAQAAYENALHISPDLTDTQSIANHLVGQ